MKTALTTATLASALRAGATVVVVGTADTIAGEAFRYMEIDGLPVPVLHRPRLEVPGVRVTYPDASVLLVATLDVPRAAALLAAAEELARVTDEAV